MFDPIIEERLLCKKTITIVFITLASQDNLEYITLFDTLFNRNGVRIIVPQMFDRVVKAKALFNMFEVVDIIYMGGGDPDLYLKNDQFYQIHSAIKAALKLGVIVYGLSAGATILGKNSINFSFTADFKSIYDLVIGPGWGLLPFSVATHVEYLNDKAIFGKKELHGDVLFLPGKAVVKMIDELVTLLREDPEYPTFIMNHSKKRIIHV